MKIVPIAIVLICVSAAFGQKAKEVKISSTADGSMQPAMMYVPEQASDTPMPLLVLLHTWSGGYTQKGWIDPCVKECSERGWALVHPHFRGPNRTPQACGSELAVQDVIDAVEFMKTKTKIDDRRIYLTGTSGGGHMSLLMAGRAPQIWAAVSAWVPISDIAAWHAQTKAAGRRYFRDIEKSCGGVPGESAEVDAQCVARSPVTWLAKAVNVPLDINGGIHDGHTGSVPVSHSLHAFNVLADANDQAANKVTDDELAFIWSKRKMPQSMSKEAVEDSDRKHAVLFRRSVGQCRVTVFDGGHTGEMQPAIRWLAKHVKK